ncbi:DMT family transporter [Pseudomonadota bacterium]|nr:DMT family transporter [Pseudomonadota bacterium]
MPNSRVIILTTLAMIAFAANSLLCRFAFKNTGIDAASFTSIRLISGAVILWAIISIRGGSLRGQGNWLSALSLFVYAAGFSFAYINLSTGTGALLLFGSVQATMIGYGLWMGERLVKLQIMGLFLALIGVIVLLLPGISAPPLPSAMMMLAAGIAWGIYSLRGKGEGEPILITAGNFFRAMSISIIMCLFMLENVSIDRAGVGFAVLSGALASGLGYAIWYTVLPALKASNAAIVQLSVPVIAAVAGIVFLAEPVTLQFGLASLAILGGIALFIVEKRTL